MLSIAAPPAIAQMPPNVTVTETKALPTGLVKVEVTITTSKGQLVSKITINNGQQVKVQQEFRLVNGQLVLVQEEREVETAQAGENQLDVEEAENQNEIETEDHNGAESGHESGGDHGGDSEGGHD